MPLLSLVCAPLGPRGSQRAAVGMQAVEEDLLVPTWVSMQTCEEVQPGVGRDGARPLNLKVVPDYYEGMFCQSKSLENIS